MVIHGAAVAVDKQLEVVNMLHTTNSRHICESIRRRQSVRSGNCGIICSSNSSGQSGRLCTGVVFEKVPVEKSAILFGGYP